MEATSIDQAISTVQSAIQLAKRKWPDATSCLEEVEHFLGQIEETLYNLAGPDEPTPEGVLRHFAWTRYCLESGPGGCEEALERMRSAAGLATDIYRGAREAAKSTLARCQRSLAALERPRSSPEVEIRGLLAEAQRAFDRGKFLAAQSLADKTWVMLDEAWEEYQRY